MNNTESPPSEPHSRRPKAYSYVRFSSPEQARGDSFRRQIEQARDYARRHGLDLDESFRDEGVSAFNGKHRGPKAALGRLVEQIKTKETPPGSYLLIESFDRLSRQDILSALKFFIALIDEGIVIVTLGDGERLYSKATIDISDLMMSLFIMSRAHEESAIKSKRVSAAWEAKRARARKTGEAMTSRCPGWLRVVEGRDGRREYEVIEEHADIVRSFFADTIAGIGRRTIAKKLNERRVPTWGIGNSRSDKWNDSYIEKTISNPAVYGKFVPKARPAGASDAKAEAPIERYFPPIVDEETFWKAQAASKGRGMGKGNGGPTNRNVLRGLAKCEFCGANMVVIDKGARSRGLKLRCGSAHQSAGCEHRDLYDYKTVEIGVIHGLGPKRADLATAAKDTAKAASDALIAAGMKLESKEAELARMLDLVQQGVDVPQVVERTRLLGVEVAALKEEVAKIERERSEANVADPAGDVADIGAIYAEIDRLTREERVRARAEMREKLTHLVEKVVIGPGGFITHHRNGGSSRAWFVGPKHA